AFAASASALQLSSVAELPSDFNGNPGCVAAYEASISECKTFSPCSSDCKKALDSTANNIIVSCRQATISSSATVLKAAMGGGSARADAVCSGSEEEEKAEKEDPSPTSTKKSTATVSADVKTPSSDTELVIADDIDLPKVDKTEKEEAASSSTGSAKQSATGSADKKEDDSANGGDPFSPGSGDADEDSAAGSVKVMAGLVGAAFFGAM